MTAKFSYAGSDLGNTIIRLGAIGGLTTYASKGAPATSTITLEDPSGVWTIDPFREFKMEEFACSAPVAYKGYITSRIQSRAEALRTSTARKIDVSLEDQNAVLSMKLITHSTFHYKRPAETDATRIAWLMAQVLNTLPVYDKGLIDTASPVTLSAVDYTGQFAIQVLNDCANRSGKNFFIYNDPATGQMSLAYFKSTNATLFQSTLSISNVLADASSTCFQPLVDATRTNDPSLVYDGVYMPYTGGSVYVRATGRYLARDVVGPSANTNSRARATELAQAMLANHSTEPSNVTCTIQIPASQVNLLLAGMRINAKFSHLQGWESGQNVRVMARTIKQDENSDQFYNVTIEIGHPVLVNFKTGSDPDNGRQWPPSPFQPGTGGAFTFVQAAKTPNDTVAAPTATFGATPTSGNFLVACLLVSSTGSLGPSDFTATFPSGWDLVQGPIGTAANNRLQGIWIASKVAGASEPTTVAPTITYSGNPGGSGYLTMAEYSGATNPSVSVLDAGTLTGPSNTGALAALTPPTGAAILIVQAVAHEPNYTSTYSAGWNNRTETTVGGPRQAIALVDQIIASASGSSYTGTATVAGIGESNWYIPAVAFVATGAEPAIGQGVSPESATANGTTTLYTTSYPYAPGSLQVKVGGVPTTVTETDPTLGTFTLPAAPPSGTIITWTYTVADPAPTGANNPAPTASISNVPTVIVPLTNKSGGSVAAGDVVIVDTTNDRSFTTTTSAGVTKPVGVAQATIANNATGLVALQGYVALVNVPSSQTRGQYLATHTVAKQATGAASRVAGSFAYLMTGGTTPSAYLFGAPDLGTGTGTTSPLTTKGDVWGFSTVDARIPIGTNGQVLTADSAQTLGLKWASGGGVAGAVKYPTLKPATPTDDFSAASLSGSWSAHSSGGSFATTDCFTQGEDWIGSSLDMQFSAQQGRLYRTHANGDLDVTFGGIRTRGFTGTGFMVGIAALNSSGTGVGVTAYNDGNCYLTTITAWDYTAFSDSWTNYGLPTMSQNAMFGDYWFRLKRVSGTWTGYVSRSGKVWDKTFATRADSITVDRIAIGLLYNASLTYYGQVIADYYQEDV